MKSRRYPHFHWGFTTQNFSKAVPVTPEAVRNHILHARERGYSWIELRDPEAGLSIDDCKALADFARGQGIEVNYSAQRGLLADDFMEVIARAAANTAVFDGPRVVRVLALRGAGEFGWDDAEFARMLQNAKAAAALAVQHGLRLAVENAEAALYGRHGEYHGMHDFLLAAPPEVWLQLDTSNLFCLPIIPSPDEAASFIRSHAKRVAYLHLKSARDGKALTRLDGNPLPFSQIFDIVANTAPTYVAIELSGSADAAAVRAEMDASITHLRETGILDP
jgi:sugar phosphate isomerase/epimerase